MENLDFEALERRMGKLERSTRRWQGLGFVCALSCALVVLGGWAPPNAKLKGDQLVESVTVKQDGKTVAKLVATDKGPALQLFGSDQQGTEDIARCQLAITGEDAILHIGCKENPRFDTDAKIDGIKGGMIVFGTARGKMPAKVD